MIRRRNSNPRQRGLALVLVLWLITVLSLLALAFGYQQRTGLHITRNLLDATRALQLTEAATQRAIHRLLTVAPDAATSDEKPAWSDFDLAQARLRYRIEREADKLDLRRATPPQLRQLLSSLGVSDGRARLLAEAILQIRDDDDGNGLVSLRALGQIDGIDPTLYQRLLSRVTLFGNTDTTAAGAAYTVLAEARLASGGAATTRSVIWLPRAGAVPYYRLDFEQWSPRRPAPKEQP